MEKKNYNSENFQMQSYTTHIQSWFKDLEFVFFLICTWDSFVYNFLCYLVIQFKR